MKVRIVVICTVILGGLAGLALFTGKKGGTVLVVDAHRVSADLGQFRNRDLRVRGFVKPGSVLRFGDKANFVLATEKGELKVHHDGSTQLPDAFADGAPARADGRLDSGGRLVSHKVEAKCASKYDAGAEHNKAMGKNPYGKGKSGKKSAETKSKSI